MPYKINRSFQPILKKVIQRNGKNPIFVHPGLGYALKKLKVACKIFFGKCSFEYKIRFAVEKKNKKNWGNFNITLKNFCCRHQKNASHTIFIYGSVWLPFFHTFDIWN